MAIEDQETQEPRGLTLIGFIDGPVYVLPETIIVTIVVASINVFTIALPGPLVIIHSTAKVITKVSIPSANAPVCTSTFREGPVSMLLNSGGITSLIARTPPTAPSA